ncbi:MAG: aminotransferase class IV [Anaerolineales bacterium]|nr:aminotransferase class IV [Anaerolineales bacterium]
MPPTTIGILTPNGLQAVPYSADTLNVAAPFEPDGIYTVASTFNRDHVLLLDAHLDRMEESARLEGIALHLDRTALRSALRALIERSDYPNSRFRITISRQDPTHIILSLEPFAGLPESVRQSGVHVATIPITRRNPRAKTNDWMKRRAEAKAAIPDAYEGIILNEVGQLLEGMGSNFYAIRGGVLYTAGDDLVLSGISRKIVQQVAPAIVQVIYQPIALSDVNTLAEAFLTSSSRGVVPIVQIDDIPLGTGQVGPLTRQIQAAYDAWVTDHLEPI